MRCRKVRSLLSAACFDELDGRRLLAVREHLSNCATCRHEASLYTSIKQTSRELRAPKLADDFNVRLLNRIAQERFHETRTRAFLPHRAPRLAWRVVAPAMAATALVVVVAVGVMMGPGGESLVSRATVPAPLDDSYLTAQPLRNPNVARGMNGDWSLTRQVAAAERLDRISHQLVDRHGFAGMYTGGSLVRNVTPDSIQELYNALQPGSRVYRARSTSGAWEENSAY